jgi:hypothetical protein
VLVVVHTCWRRVLPEGSKPSLNYHSFGKPPSFAKSRDDGCIVADHHDDDGLCKVATSSVWAGKQQHDWRLDETMHRAYAILEAARSSRTGMSS